MNMKWIGLTLVILGFVGFILWRQPSNQFSVTSPLGTVTVAQKPLRAYSIDQLSARRFEPSMISLGDVSIETDSFIVRPFYFTSEGKNVSGIAHIPVGNGPFPVIVQFRGYADPTIYTPGMGTKRSAEVFATNGYISLAPDFLGYGTSDPLSNNIFLDRFETYTTALTLLASVGSFPKADASRIGIWGHSNGGQIALTALEILQKPIPTTLWAPVTKPFPYSILYYTDDADDHGKFLRKELASFEALYDVEHFSLTNYIDRLHDPIQLHQGGNDVAVPQSWNDSFVPRVKKAGIDIQYFTYPAADHNMVPNWNTVVQRDVEFFKRYL